MNKNVNQMCHNCLTCQRRSKRPTKKTYDIGALNSKWIFDTVALDLIGPISYWNETYYALTMIDHASKWAEVAIMEDITAKAIADTFIHTWVQRFGVPRRVLTDRGANFIKAFDKHAAATLGFMYIKTSPYHPEGNGVCEAFTKYLKTTVMKIVTTHPNLTIQMIISMAMMNYRSSPHGGTQETPFTLLTGLDFRLPTFFTVDPHGKIDLKARTKALTRLREEAFWQILSRQRREEVTCIRDQISEGDLVLIRLTPGELHKRRQHVITAGQNSPKWSLPKRVITVKHEGSQLLVRDLFTGKEQDVSNHNVKMFMGDSENIVHQLSYNKERQDERKPGEP